MSSKIYTLVSYCMWPLLLLVVLLRYTKSVDVAFYLDTKEVVHSWGYPIEVHTVTTTDGFILELHRIPHGRSPTHSKNTSKPVIFLQHGFLCSSFDWVANLPSQSAGFVFADAGFDVWMGNFRGNTYSRKHVSLNPNSDQKFWDWSWDQIAEFDIPAAIGKALEVSGQSEVYYVGHSLGTLTMFAKLSTDPSFGKYVKKFFALAPVATVQHIRGAFSFLGRHFGSNFQHFASKNGPAEFMHNSWIFRNVVKYSCGLFETMEELCTDIALLFVGTSSSSENWNQTRTPVYLAHTPAGSSSNVMAHFQQMLTFGGLSAFDMGERRNVMMYGQKVPPQYDFSRIKNVPVYLFWSDEDWLSTRKDLNETLFSHFQNNFRVPDYNHLHFIWGTNAAEEIYNPITAIIMNSNK